MKRAIAYIFNKPLLVGLVSLVVAVFVAYVVTVRTDAAVPRVFVKATSGTIATQTGNAAQNHLTLAFLTSGRIATVTVNVGDTVQKDQVLASLDAGNISGSITQAQASLASANANYQKVLNGATGPTIDSAKAILNTATISLQQIRKQQDVNVNNAYNALLNVTPQAYLTDYTNSQAEDEPPTITGSYMLQKEGQITIKTFSSVASSGASFNLSGLATGTENVTGVTPQPLGNTGLFIKFQGRVNPNRTWVISLPNTKASDYVTKRDAYDSALQTQSQAVETAKAAVEQAQSNVVVVTAAARPEDVAAAQAQVESAQGALQIAQAAYDNTLLKAPADGTVTAVRITQGQIAVPNTPALEIASTASSVQVNIMVPNTAIIDQDGKKYVLVDSPQGVTQREITTGISDGQNTQVVSGLSVGEDVAIQQ